MVKIRGDRHMELFIKYAWALVLIAVLLLALAIILKIRRIRKERGELKTATIIDQMSMRRASIDTTFLEKRFREVCERMLRGIYSQNVLELPKQDMLPALFDKCYAEIKREFELGVKKQVNVLNVEKFRVTKQENSSMYAVTHIEVEATVYVDFNYSHATGCHRNIRRYTQRYVFLNANNTWLLESCGKEQYMENQRIPF
jgi:hypothetical protein